MNLEWHKIKQNGREIAILDSNQLFITDTQSALDLMASIRYEAGCDRFIIKKNNICEEFFDLKTGIAGGILQKMINYHFKLAIVGDYSAYSSKSLKDFIYEMNNGKDIFFLTDEARAIEKLGSV